MPPSKLSKAQLWNSLPDDIVQADSLLIFRRQLKQYLFQQSYPDVVLQLLPNCVTVTLLVIDPSGRST